MTFVGPVPGVLGATFRDAAQLPAHLLNGNRVDPWTEAIPGTLLFGVPGIARYLVEHGTTIGVEAAPGSDRAAVELFLYGSARGALIHQRGELPLEAATVMTPAGQAVAISSYSACGKSTVAAELCRRGWLLVADDITRITWTRGRALAWPSHASLKLWHDACAGFGIDTDNLRPVRAGMQKFFVQMRASSAPATLQAVIRLQVDKELRSIEVPADRRAAALTECTFRWRQIAGLGQQAAHQRLVQNIAPTCRVLVLGGAREHTINDLADQIIRVLS